MRPPIRSTASTLAQGMKAPIIYSQRDPTQSILQAVRKAFDDLERLHGSRMDFSGEMRPCMAAADPRL